MGDKGEVGVLDLPNVPNRTFLIFFSLLFLNMEKIIYFSKQTPQDLVGITIKLFFAQPHLVPDSRAKKKPIVDPVGVIYYFLP